MFNIFLCHTKKEILEQMVVILPKLKRLNFTDFYRSNDNTFDA